MWSSNAPFAPTGYGVQTKHFIGRIQALGHEVAVAANHGIETGIISWPGPRGSIPLFPRGNDLWSRDIIVHHCEYFKADVIIQLYDAWCYPERIVTPKIAYFPADMEPLAEPVRKALEKADMCVAMSRFGQGQVEDAGLECEYVPHVYDRNELWFDGRDEFRETIKAGDKFVVGIVAANKFTPPRKAWPQLFEGFARFHRENPETLLYVHSNHSEAYQGVDLQKLASYYEIPSDAIAFCNQYGYQIGFPDNYMRSAYSAMDVLLLTSMGEGFGIPIIEAQACGTPVIVGEWTAMPELCESGLLLHRDEAFRQHVPGFADQYLAHPDAIYERLRDISSVRFERAEVASRVKKYEADYVTETYWKPALEKFEARLGVQPHIRRVA